MQELLIKRNCLLLYPMSSNGVCLQLGNQVTVIFSVFIRLSRMNISTGSSSSKYYRKEKALKIYTADDDYKTTASDDVS